MAKGTSKLAGRMVECQEVVGEYRRTDGVGFVLGRAAGTGDPNQAAQVGSLPTWTCGEPGAGLTGTPGSGGGSEKPTSGNAGRALRVDLTVVNTRFGSARKIRANLEMTSQYLLNFVCREASVLESTLTC